MAGMRRFGAGLRNHILIAALCFTGNAQSATQRAKAGQIRGHVADIAGAVITKASVFVRRSLPPEDSVRLVTKTDAKGDFAFVLPEGGYDVLVTYPGFLAAVQTVPVLDGKTRKTEWKLKPIPCGLPGTVCDTFE